VNFSTLKQSRGALPQFTFIYLTQLSNSLQNAEGIVFPLHSMKAYRGSTATLIINLGTGWMTAFNFTPHLREITLISTEIRLAGPQSQPGNFGDDKPLPFQEFEPLIFQPIATPPTIFRFHNISNPKPNYLYVTYLIKQMWNQLIILKFRIGKFHIFAINNTGQQNLTFFLAHEEKYLILIELLTLNSNV